VPKICFLLITGWHESGKAILNETLIVYNANGLVRLDKQLFGASLKYFSGKDGSVPHRKIGPYACALIYASDLSFK